MKSVGSSVLQVGEDVTMIYRIKCQFCDSFEKDFQIREKATKEIKKHLLKNHESELRERFLQAKKCAKNKTAEAISVTI